MGRQKVKARRLSLGIDNGIDGWAEYASRKEPRGLTGYIMRLMYEDRDRQLQDAETNERYVSYLKATERDEELATLDNQ